jgi:hypothetical protein
MVSLETTQQVVFLLFIACVIIFVLFIWKIPIVCSGCEDPVGIWYRCISGGSGTGVCDISQGKSSSFLSSISKTIQELLDVGIKDIPNAVIQAVVYIQTKLASLASDVMGLIQSVISGIASEFTSLFNDYIAQPIQKGSKFISDNIIMPVINGISSYIVKPIQELIESIRNVGTLARNAIEFAYLKARQISITVWDNTFGRLLDGFDKIPSGLIAFVEEIQDILNGLKNGIIGGSSNNRDGVFNSLKVNADPNKGVNMLIKKTMVGLETAVNGMTYGANYLLNPVIKNVVNPVGKVISDATSYIPFSWFMDPATLPSVNENVIPEVTFGQDFGEEGRRPKGWGSYITPPDDLFWAGKRYQPIPMAIEQVCPFTCKKAGFDTGIRSTSGDCLCVKQSQVLHSNTLDSCTDVCNSVGGVSTTPDPSSTCGSCVNEIVLSRAPMVLPYRFSCFQVPTDYTPNTGSTFFNPDNSNQLQTYISSLTFPTKDYTDTASFTGVLGNINNVWSITISSMTSGLILTNMYLYAIPFDAQTSNAINSTSIPQYVGKLLNSTIDPNTQKTTWNIINPVSNISTYSSSSLFIGKMSQPSASISGYTLAVKGTFLYVLPPSNLTTVPSGVILEDMFINGTALSLPPSTNISNSQSKETFLDEGTYIISSTGVSSSYVSLTANVAANLYTFTTAGTFTVILSFDTIIPTNLLPNATSYLVSNTQPVRLIVTTGPNGVITSSPQSPFSVSNNILVYTGTITKWITVTVFSGTQSSTGPITKTINPGPNTLYDFPITSNGVFNATITTLDYGTSTFIINVTNGVITSISGGLSGLRFSGTTLSYMDAVVPFVPNPTSGPVVTQKPRAPYIMTLSMYSGYTDDAMYLGVPPSWIINKGVTAKALEDSKDTNGNPLPVVGSAYGSSPTLNTSSVYNLLSTMATLLSNDIKLLINEKVTFFNDCNESWFNFTLQNGMVRLGINTSTTVSAIGPQTLTFDSSKPGSLLFTIDLQFSLNPIMSTAFGCTKDIMISNSPSAPGNNNTLGVDTISSDFTKTTVSIYGIGSKAPIPVIQYLNGNMIYNMDNSDGYSGLIVGATNNNVQLTYFTPSTTGIVVGQSITIKDAPNFDVSGIPADFYLYNVTGIVNSMIKDKSFVINVANNKANPNARFSATWNTTSTVTGLFLQTGLKLCRIKNPTTTVLTIQTNNNCPISSITSTFETNGNTLSYTYGDISGHYIENGTVSFPDYPTQGLDLSGNIIYGSAATGTYTFTTFLTTLSHLLINDIYRQSLFLKWPRGGYEFNDIKTSNFNFGLVPNSNFYNLTLLPSNTGNTERDKNNQFFLILKISTNLLMQLNFNTTSNIILSNFSITSVTGNKVSTPMNNITNLTNQYFYGEWLQVQLFMNLTSTLDKGIIPTGYLMSVDPFNLNGMATSWYVLGSTDQLNWLVLDYQTNQTKWSDGYTVRYNLPSSTTSEFALTNGKLDKYFTFIRLIITQVASTNTGSFSIGLFQPTYYDSIQKANVSIFDNITINSKVYNIDVSGTTDLSGNVLRYKSSTYNLYAYGRDNTSYLYGVLSSSYDPLSYKRNYTQFANDWVFDGSFVTQNQLNLLSTVYNNELIGTPLTTKAYIRVIRSDIFNNTLSLLYLDIYNVIWFTQINPASLLYNISKNGSNYNSPPFTKDSANIFISNICRKNLTRVIDIKMSQNGQYQLVSLGQGIPAYNQSYKSSNFGKVWTLINIPSFKLLCIDMNLSGKNQVICCDTGSEQLGYYIYTSNDFGVSWRLIKNKILNDKDSKPIGEPMVIKTNGTYITIITKNGYILSYNGTTITNSRLLTTDSINKCNICIADSGMYQVISISNYNFTTERNDNYIYYSSNYGINWTKSICRNGIFSLPTFPTISDLVADSTCQYLTAMISSETQTNMYNSYDFGVTWWEDILKVKDFNGNNINLIFQPNTLSTTSDNSLQMCTISNIPDSRLNGGYVYVSQGLIPATYEFSVIPWNPVYTQTGLSNIVVSDMSQFQYCASTRGLLVSTDYGNNWGLTINSNRIELEGGITFSNSINISYTKPGDTNTIVAINSLGKYQLIATTHKDVKSDSVAFSSIAISGNQLLITFSTPITTSTINNILSGSINNIPLGARIQITGTNTLIDNQQFTIASCTDTVLRTTTNVSIDNVTIISSSIPPNRTGTLTYWIFSYGQNNILVSNNFGVTFSTPTLNSLIVPPTPPQVPNPAPVSLTIVSAFHPIQGSAVWKKAMIDSTGQFMFVLLGTFVYVSYDFGTNWSTYPVLSDVTQISMTTGTYITYPSSASNIYITTFYVYTTYSSGSNIFSSIYPYNQVVTTISTNNSITITNSITWDVYLLTKRSSTTNTSCLQIAQSNPQLISSQNTIGYANKTIKQTIINSNGVFRYNSISNIDTDTKISSSLTFQISFPSTVVNSNITNNNINNPLIKSILLSLSMPDGFGNNITLKQISYIPSRISISTTTTSAILSFLTTPVTTGTTTYYATYYTTTRIPITTSSTTTSPITINGLQSGTSYSFTITSTNDSSSYIGSATSDIIMTKTLCLPPSGVNSSVVSNNSISISFTESVGATSYSVLSSNGTTTIGTKSPILITGLDGSTSYTFTVFAIHEYGSSIASASTTAVTFTNPTPTPIPTQVNPTPTPRVTPRVTPQVTPIVTPQVTPTETLYLFSITLMFTIPIHLQYQDFSTFLSSLITMATTNGSKLASSLNSSSIVLNSLYKPILQPTIITYEKSLEFTNSLWPSSTNPPTTTGSNWSNITMDAEGVYQTACLFNGTNSILYHSVDSGAKWYISGNSSVSSQNTTSIIVPGQVQSISCSSDGLYLSLITTSGIYNSSNTSIDNLGNPAMITRGVEPGSPPKNSIPILAASFLNKGVYNDPDLTIPVPTPLPNPFTKAYTAPQFILTNNYRIGDSFSSNNIFSTKTQLITDITYCYEINSSNNNLSYNFYSPTDGINYNGVILLTTGFIRVDFISELVAQELCDDINQNTNNFYQLTTQIVSLTSVSPPFDKNAPQDNTYTFQILNNNNQSTIYVITLRLSSSPLLRTIFGINSDVPLININLIAYQNNVPQQIVLYDTALAPFCGNTQEINVSYPLNQIQYRFLAATNTKPNYNSWSYVKILTLPDIPTDRFGIPIDPKNFTGYTPFYLTETLSYLLSTDIAVSTNQEIKIDFSPFTTTKEVGGKYSIRFEYNINNPAYMVSITILSSQNIIFAQALGSTADDITATTGQQSVSGTAVQGNTIISRGLTTSLFLPYVFRDSSKEFSFNSNIVLYTTIMNNVTYQSFLTTLGRLLYNDITTITKDSYGLSAKCFHFVATSIPNPEGTALQTTCSFAFKSSMNPQITITINFSPLTALRDLLGLKEQGGRITLFNMSDLDYFISPSPVSSGIFYQVYKGVDIYYIQKKAYVYIYPKLIKAGDIIYNNDPVQLNAQLAKLVVPESAIPPPGWTPPPPGGKPVIIPVNPNATPLPNPTPLTQVQALLQQEYLQTNFFKVFTSPDSVDDYYYFQNDNNGNDLYYAPIIYQNAYEIDTRNTISIPANQTPLDKGFIGPKLTPTNLPYYLSPASTFFLGTTPDASGNITMIELSLTPVPMPSQANPVIINYVFSSSLAPGYIPKKGTIRLPPQTYTQTSLGTKIVELLLAARASDTNNVTIATAIGNNTLSITYDTIIKKYTFSIIAPIGQANCVCKIELIFDGSGSVDSNLLMANLLGYYKDLSGNRTCSVFNPITFLNEPSTDPCLISNVPVNTIVSTSFPMVQSPAATIPLNPFGLTYTFEDSKFSFTRVIILNTDNFGNVLNDASGNPLSFSRFTPKQWAYQLQSRLVRDINSFTGYSFLQGTDSAGNSLPINQTSQTLTVTYNKNGQYVFSASSPSRFFSNCAITLRFDLDTQFIPKPISPRTSWAATFGCGDSLTFGSYRKTPNPTADLPSDFNISPFVPVPTDPLTLPWEFQDNFEKGQFYSGTIQFPVSQFTGNKSMPELAKDLSKLLFNSIKAKLQTTLTYYSSFTESSISITSDGYSFIYSLTTIPATITLRFETSSVLAALFGCSAISPTKTPPPGIVWATIPLKFSSTQVTISPSVSTTSILFLEGYNLFNISSNICVWIENTDQDGKLLDGKGAFYTLNTGSSVCMFNQSSTQPAPTIPYSCNKIKVPPSEYDLSNNNPPEFTSYSVVNTAQYFLRQKTVVNGVISNMVFKKVNYYAYNENHQLLYQIITNIYVPRQFYGSLSENNFVLNTTCTLDASGNCTLPSINMFTETTTSKSYIVGLPTYSLLGFTRDNIQGTTCPCLFTATVTPTCEKICASGQDPTGDPFLSDVPNQIPNADGSNCACYYLGPVNKIAKPMRDFNPFRMLGDLVGTAVSSLSRSISDACKPFLLPLWDAVRTIMSFVGAIVSMIVEFFKLYANPVALFNILADYVKLGVNEGISAFQSFVKNTIQPAIDTIIGFKDVIMKGINDMAGYVWEQLKVVLSEMSKTFSLIVSTLVTFAIDTGKWLWDNYVVYGSKVADIIFCWLPATTSIRFNIMNILILFLISNVYGIPNILNYIFTYAIKPIASIAVNFVGFLIWIIGAIILKDSEL